MLKIDLKGQTTFEPGEQIDVDVEWSLSEPPESLELRVVWNTSGKGSQDIGVAAIEKLEFPSANDRRRMSLTLPREPYSFSGRLISIIWALELVSLPTEESTRTVITIGPDGRETVALGTTDAGV